jgi:hypothetical protein
MPTPIKTYDLASVYLIIGGYRIGGYGEEGGIEFEYGADIGETKVGADGQATFSRNNNDSMIVTITVMETSKSYKDLAALMQAQIDAETIEALAFLMEDEINGDKIRAAYATFLTRPTPNKGRTVGERAFKVFLPNAATEAQFGANIAI